MPSKSVKQETVKPLATVQPLTNYQVLHPVLKGKTLHPRGSVVPLNSHDGAHLHKQGHVIPVVEPVAVSELPAELPVNLQGFTDTQLIEYALETHGRVLAPSLSRADLLLELGFKAGESA